MPRLLGMLDLRPIAEGCARRVGSRRRAFVRPGGTSSHGQERRRAQDLWTSRTSSPPRRRGSTGGASSPRSGAPGRRRWRAGRPRTTAHADATRLLGDVAALEDYWAYPGPRLMATVAEALRDRNAGGVRAARGEDLHGARHRRLPPRHQGLGSARGGRRARPGRAAPGRAAGRGPQAVLRGAHRHPQRSRAAGSASRADLRRLRRPEDSFVYEIVHVGSFEDAAHRRDLQHERAGGGDLRRLPVPVAPRLAGHARLPDAEPRASTRTPSSPARSPPRSRGRSRATGPSWTSTC